MILYVIVIISTQAANPQVNVGTCINVLLGIVFVSNMHYVCNIVNEIVTELGIRVFRVKDKTNLLEGIELK